MQSKDYPPPYSASAPYDQQQGYVPPQQGYAPPQQGYAPPQQGYAPPQQGYPAATQGYAPPQTGYAPPIHTQQQQSNTTVVVQQPGVGASFVYQANPTDYTVSSILACLFCFMPTGIAAIYFASRSRTELSLGNVGEAHRMANNARNLIIASVICGIGWVVLVIILQVAVVSASTY